MEYVDEKETIEGAPGLRDEHLPVFDCAFRPRNGMRSIHWMGHIRMMGAVQPFLSGAISKTVNLPSEATADDLKQAYVEGWRLGLKALAVYRDGSKRTQPLNTGKDEEKKAEVIDLDARRADPREAARRARLDHAQVLDRRATRAISPSASTRTARPARSSCAWRRRAARSPA